MQMSTQSRDSVSRTAHDMMAHSAHGGGSSSGNAWARVGGSAIAGCSELLVFHPIDTIAKRLMHNRTDAAQGLSKIIFVGEAQQAGVVQKWLSLFPGLGFGAAYKISQRVYKFGGQPYVRDYMDQKVGKQFRGTFGDKTGRGLMYACAGSLMGAGEVFLLPLDALKIKAQTNPEQLKGRSVMSFIKEGPALYRGWQWTIARNVPGSFSLFGGSAFIKDVVFGLENYSDATFFQDSMASIGGATASITVAAPLDVIKTRIQARPFNSPESGADILKGLVRNEGVGGFFKGLTPKLMAVGPKLVFSFTIAQQMISYFEKKLS